jgi:hypothetical protein
VIAAGNSSNPVLTSSFHSRGRHDPGEGRKFGAARLKSSAVAFRLRNFDQIAGKILL